MAETWLRYDRMVEDALRSVVRKALIEAAQRGLPGEHHFYITFHTERPGVGTVKDPKTGKWLDETRHLIEGFDFLSAAEKKMIFEDNAKKVFKIQV